MFDFFYYYGYGYFSYLIFMLPALVISLWAQISVKSTFHKYSGLRTGRGLTGAQAAQEVLRFHNVMGVRCERVAGQLTDHFDPRTNVIRLSDGVYGSDSVSAVGVAAHEAGHAVQYAQEYGPMKLRSVMVPITNIGSRLSLPVILFGYFLSIGPLVTLGIVLFSLSVLFQLVTLPVEFNASRRAVNTLEQAYVLSEDELKGVKKVLRAAAMTYLAATFTALWSLLRREPVRVAVVGRSAVDPPEGGAAARGCGRRHGVHVGARLRHDHLIARAVQRAHRRDGRPVFSVGHDGCFHVRSLPLLARSCRFHAPYDTKPAQKIQDGAAGALPKKQSAREMDSIRNGGAQVCSCPATCGRPRSAGRETPSRNSAPCSAPSRGSRSTPARPRAGARAAWTTA